MNLENNNTPTVVEKIISVALGLSLIAVGLHIAVTLAVPAINDFLIYLARSN